MSTAFIKFSLGSVYTFPLGSGDDGVESATSAYVTYEIGDEEGEVEITGPLARRIAEAIAATLAVPT